MRFLNPTFCWHSIFFHLLYPGLGHFLSYNLDYDPDLTKESCILLQKNVCKQYHQRYVTVINLKGLEARDINEKRRYFHLPVKKKPTTIQLLEESPDLRLPSDNAKSALSYLIFNTADNPYAKRKDFSNPLNNQKANKTKKEEDEGADKTTLGEAPVSLGIGLDDVDGTADLFFAPALGDLPDLDLPDILDLPNLPTDLSYMTDLGPGIAPSVQQIPDFPEDDGIPEDAEALLSAPPPPPPPSLIPPPPQPTSAPVQVAPTMPALVPGKLIINLHTTLAVRPPTAINFSHPLSCSNRYSSMT